MLANPFSIPQPRPRPALRLILAAVTVVLLGLPQGAAGAPRRAELEKAARRASAAYQAGDYETAASGFLSLVQWVPDDAGARLAYARSEMALGRDRRALPVVLDGLARDPDDARLHEVLGDLRYRADRLDEALRSWRRAESIGTEERRRHKIAKVEREHEVGSRYRDQATSHFRVQYDSDVDRALADAVMDELEQAYGAVTGSLSHAPAEPISVILYPHGQFHEVTGSPRWVAGLYDGKIRVPLGGRRHLDAESRKILTHELVHAVVHSKARGRCPRWLHEGLAQILEGKQLLRRQHLEVARRLQAGDPAGWETRGFNHTMALSLTRYLESRWGLDGLVRILDLLGDGSDLDTALRRVYGGDYAEICHNWARSAGSTPAS